MFTRVWRDAMEGLRYGCDVADAEWMVHRFSVQDAVRFMEKATSLVDAGD